MSLENPYYIWLILAVLFVVVEIFTAGFFYACFAIGALSAMVTGFITRAILGASAYGLVWQIVVFCVVSVALIPVSRSFARKISDDSVPQAGADALIGLQGIVIESINPVADVGKVKVDGQVWRAVASDIIESGSTVKVTDVRGAKLAVEKIN
ncbi:MAG: NfeD family protein [Candidatus Zixiibacteriota bacterium]|nr:MAG: NfeD family protein [candidate division Zixibacteria bacterium]